MEELFYPSADGVHTVHAVYWLPQGKPRAVLQIIHGMEEYAARYAPFALKAAELGFFVCAEDHLGHGGTAKKEERGHFPRHGEEVILKDIRSLTLRAQEAVPGVPVFVLGHSMGSFFCREYIARFGGDLAGAVIMGTGFKDGFTLFFCAGAGFARRRHRRTGAQEQIYIKPCVRRLQQTLFARPHLI